MAIAATRPTNACSHERDAADDEDRREGFMPIASSRGLLDTDVRKSAFGHNLNR
jgi:hypothetical protein